MIFLYGIVRLLCRREDNNLTLRALSLRKNICTGINLP